MVPEFRLCEKVFWSFSERYGFSQDEVSKAQAKLFELENAAADVTSASKQRGSGAIIVQTEDEEGNIVNCNKSGSCVASYPVDSSPRKRNQTRSGTTTMSLVVALAAEEQATVSTAPDVRPHRRSKRGGGGSRKSDPEVDPKDTASEMAGLLLTRREIGVQCDTNDLDMVAVVRMLQDRIETLEHELREQANRHRDTVEAARLEVVTETEEAISLALRLIRVLN